MSFFRVVGLDSIGYQLLFCPSTQLPWKYFVERRKIISYHVFPDFSAVRKIPYVISSCLVLLVIENRKIIKGTKRVMYTERITESQYNSVVCYENSTGCLLGVRILRGHEGQQSSDFLRTATADIKFFCFFNCDLCLWRPFNVNEFESFLDNFQGILLVLEEWDW